MLMMSLKIALLKADATALVMRGMLIVWRVVGLAYLDYHADHAVVMMVYDKRPQQHRHQTRKHYNQTHTVHHNASKLLKFSRIHKFSHDEKHILHIMCKMTENWPAPLHLLQILPNVLAVSHNFSNFAAVINQSIHLDLNYF